MIDEAKLAYYLAEYISDFKGKHWEDERYKWAAVKRFQDVWDVESPDFAAMLEASLDKTGNLLTSYSRFPKGMIVQFAQRDPEGVRSLFRDLFDEGEDVIGRIESFKEKVGLLHSRVFPEAPNHYQDENAITTYLWLRFPDKYFIHKYGEAKGVAKALTADVSIKKGDYENNLRNLFELYEGIREALAQDDSLRDALDSCLDDECYPDPALVTATVDFGFFINHYSCAAKEGEMIIDNATIPLSVREWKELLEDASVFNDKAHELISGILDLGGEASCSQLATKFNKPKNYYLSNATALAKRVQASSH